MSGTRATRFSPERVSFGTDMRTAQLYEAMPLLSKLDTNSGEWSFIRLGPGDLRVLNGRGRLE